MVRGSEGGWVGRGWERRIKKGEGEREVGRNAIMRMIAEGEAYTVEPPQYK